MGSPSEGRHPGGGAPTGSAAGDRRVRPVTEAPPRWLPPAFLARMRALLGEEEFGAFLDALVRPRVRGLRVNPAKAGAEELAALLGLELKPVPWCPTGFLVDGGRPLGAR